MESSLKWADVYVVGVPPLCPNCNHLLKEVRSVVTCMAEGCLRHACEILTVDGRHRFVCEEHAWEVYKLGAGVENMGAEG